jgi:RNA polymerase sigma-70 factor (ECF subfamily)
MPGREDRDARVSGSRDGDGGVSSAVRTVVYCLVPRDLAPKLHAQLRRHFGADPMVEVIVERRGGERRSGAERRADPRGADRSRRRIRSLLGRRVSERRASLIAVDALALPRRARVHAQRLAFVERIEPTGQSLEDADTARLITRIQAGDRDAFAVLYMRYFDRVFAYLRLAMGSVEDAEDAAQQVFVKVLGALDGYELRRQPFRAWLFTVVRNHALAELKKRGRVEVADPVELDRRRDAACDEPAAQVGALDWITDRELLIFIERLPVVQRQVLMLRFMLDLSTSEIARILDRSPTDVRRLQHRALRFLEARLTALGRGPQTGKSIRMRRIPKQALVLRRRRLAL